MTINQEVDREIILEVLPDLFPNIEKHNPELSKTIMFEVVDLPRNTPGTELEYKVQYTQHLCVGVPGGQYRSSDYYLPCYDLCSHCVYR